jgi:hypothetical protein
MDFAQLPDCDPFPPEPRNLDDEPMDLVFCYDCERMVANGW